MARLKHQWAGEYDQWRQSRLDKDRWIYLWADGIYNGLSSTKNEGGGARYLADGNTGGCREGERSKGYLSRDSMLHMFFKLGESAQKNWRKQGGFNYLAKVVQGIKFRDGEEVIAVDQRTARSAG